MSFNNLFFTLENCHLSATVWLDILWTCIRLILSGLYTCVLCHSACSWWYQDLWGLSRCSVKPCRRMKQLFWEEHVCPLCAPSTLLCIHCRQHADGKSLQAIYNNNCLSLSSCPLISCRVTHSSLIHRTVFHYNELLSPAGNLTEAVHADLFQYWSKIIIFCSLSSQSVELPTTTHAVGSRTGRCRGSSPHWRDWTLQASSVR